MKPINFLYCFAVLQVMVPGSCNGTEQIPNDQAQITNSAGSASADNDPKVPPKDVPKDYDDWRGIWQR